jgi:Domain of Unknown Function (DUF1080)
MKRIRYVAGLLFAFAVVAAFGADDKKEDGFVPLFNGKDLTGWVNVNCAPGTFFVKDGEIITTGKPTGYMRTDKQYENFVAEFDWMHVPSKPDAVGNSGFFVWGDPLPTVGTGYTRGIEVQVLVNYESKDKKTGAVTATSQGDLFSIWGATCVPERPHPLGWARCLPSENRAKGANEWNHYRVEANDGVIKLAVNGKIVSSVSKCKPRKGYLALESEGSECHFRNLKIKELPSTNPKPDEIADVAQGHKQLYTGLDLSGWKADDETKKHWQPKDWILHYDGMGKELRTEAEHGDAEFIVDFRFSKKDSKPFAFVVRDSKEVMFPLQLSVTAAGMFTQQHGGVTETRDDKDKFKPVGQWNRLRASQMGKSVQVTVNGKELIKDFMMSPAPEKGTFVLRPEGAMDFGNLFVRPLGK